MLEQRMWDPVVHLHQETWLHNPWGHVRGAWLEGGSPPGTGEVLVPLVVARQKNHTLCRALTVAAPH